MIAKLFCEKDDKIHKYLRDNYHYHYCLGLLGLLDMLDLDYNVLCHNVLSFFGGVLYEVSKTH